MRKERLKQALDVSFNKVISFSEPRGDINGKEVGDKYKISKEEFENIDRQREKQIGSKATKQMKSYINERGITEKAEPNNFEDHNATTQIDSNTINYKKELMKNGDGTMYVHELMHFAVHDVTTGKEIDENNHLVKLVRRMISKTLEAMKGEEKNGRTTNGVRLPDNVATGGMEGTKGQTGGVLSTVSEGVRGVPVGPGGLATLSEHAVLNSRDSISQNDSRGNRGEQRSQTMELGKNSSTIRKSPLGEEEGRRKENDKSEKRQRLIKEQNKAKKITSKYDKSNKELVTRDLRDQLIAILDDKETYVNDKAEMALVYLAEARQLDAKHGLKGKDSIFLNLLVNENGTASDVMYETIAYASHTNRRSVNELMSSNEIGDIFKLVNAIA